MGTLHYISEQHRKKILANLSDSERLILDAGGQKKIFPHKEMACFEIYNERENFLIDTNYFIGVDWLVPKKIAIYVEPKLNTDSAQQVHFLEMLLQSLDAPENLEHVDNLFHVEYESSWISIPENKDLLSPILIVQFLALIQVIVRKGLKNSYYRKTENVDSRIKGKILIGQQIKKNISKNRLTKTICNYQEFGTNNYENQFLKMVLQFVSSYINQKRHFFSKEQNFQLQNIVHYCIPAFQNIDLPKNIHQQLHFTKNIFYKEYDKAVKIGQYILKRFSFNVNKITETQTSTPPFWIDMSKLFELYVFGKLKKVFPESHMISYHDRYLGSKETDILIKIAPYKCVIDCKYKPQYENQVPTLEDKRQLAGYTRLRSVYRKLDIAENEVVKGLIVYSHQSFSEEIIKDALFKNQLAEYVDFYKLGLKLPEI